MDVSLPPEWGRFVQEQVDRGHFSMEEEEVCEALRLLQRNEQLDRLKLEELRRLVAVGLEQAERGEVAPLDMAAIRAEGRRALEDERRPGGYSHSSTAQRGGPNGRGAVIKLLS